MELKPVTGINRLVAKASARKDHANRWATRLHRANLAGRSVGAQQPSRLLKIEGVPEVA